MSKLLLVALVSLLPSQARSEESSPRPRPERVQVSAAITKRHADGRLTVAVKLRIAKGWHIFANQVGNEELAGFETRVAIQGKLKLDEVRVTYPQGKEIVDRAVGNSRIYEEEVVITATVRRAKDDHSPLQATVWFHPMGMGRCALPEVRKVTVKESAALQGGRTAGDIGSSLGTLGAPTSPPACPYGTCGFRRQRGLGLISPSSAPAPSPASNE